MPLDRIAITHTDLGPPGVLAPREIRWIAAETSARVERIVVKPGARVTPEESEMSIAVTATDGARVTPAESGTPIAVIDTDGARVTPEETVADVPVSPNPVASSTVVASASIAR